MPSSFMMPHNVLIVMLVPMAPLKKKHRHRHRHAPLQWPKLQLTYTNLLYVDRVEASTSPPPPKFGPKLRSNAHPILNGTIIFCD